MGKGFDLTKSLKEEMDRLEVDENALNEFIAKYTKGTSEENLMALIKLFTST